MNLHINEEKTEYIPVTQKHYVNRPTYLEIGLYKFQTASSFSYFGSEVDCNNNVSNQINK